MSISNDYYTPSGAPLSDSQGESAAIRSEFSSIKAGFDKLPIMPGNGEKLVAINPTGTGIEPISAGTARTSIGAVSSADLAASSGSMLVGFLASGTGAMLRTIQSKSRDFVSVRDFGATGNGSTDDTAAIQAALTASKYVSVPPGRYVLSATLRAQPDQVIVGSGPEITLLQRTANYGDTITVGTTAAGEGALNFHISGIWFYKPQAYTAGVTTAIDYPVTASSSHLNITVSTGGSVTDCWFNGMPYGITLVQSSLFLINKCQFSGIWDPQTAGLQESVAAIYLKSGASYNVLVSITNCSVAGGYGSATRNVTIGAATLSFSESIGAQYGVLCEACEGLYIGGNYFGGQSYYGVMLTRNNIVAGVKIEGNFFDCAIDTCIYTTTASDAAVDGLVISNNNFNGQLAGLHAIRLNDPGSWISAVNVNISNNVIENFAAGPIIISGGKGVNVSNNNISAYNTASASNTAPDYSAGVYVYGTASYVCVSGNLYGGGINALGAVNNCKWGSYFTTTTGCSASSERSVSLGLSGGLDVYGLEQSYPTIKAVLTPTLENSWVNYSGGTQQAGYWKSDDGMVHLSGLVKSGSVGGVIFTLPVGFRPATQVTFSTVSNAAFAHGNINASGALIAVTGSNISWSLDGISFKAA
jgi:hypothetical protein